MVTKDQSGSMTWVEGSTTYGCSCPVGLKSCASTLGVKYYSPGEDPPVGVKIDSASNLARDGLAVTAYITWQNPATLKTRQVEFHCPAKLASAVKSLKGKKWNYVNPSTGAASDMNIVGAGFPRRRKRR